MLIPEQTQSISYRLCLGKVYVCLGSSVYSTSIYSANLLRHTCQAVLEIGAYNQTPIFPGLVICGCGWNTSSPNSAIQSQRLLSHTVSEGRESKSSFSESFWFKASHEAVIQVFGQGFSHLEGWRIGFQHAHMADGRWLQSFATTRPLPQGCPAQGSRLLPGKPVR